MASKIKIKKNGAILTLKTKLDKGEQINQQELAVFSTKIIKGLMQPVADSDTKMSFNSPTGTTLADVLKAGITKNDFYLILANTLEMAKAVEANGLTLNNVVFDANYIIVNTASATKDLFYVYKPIFTQQLSTTFVAFMYDFVKAVRFLDPSDANCTAELMNYMNGLQMISVYDIENYVKSAYPGVYYQIGVEQQSSGSDDTVILNGGAPVESSAPASDETVILTPEMATNNAPVQPVFEQPVFEQPVVQEPVFEQPVFEQPVQQVPADDYDFGKTEYYEEPEEAPVFEAPQAPEIEPAPVVEQPVFEQPVVQEPVFEQPVFEQPVQQVPAENYDFGKTEYFEEPEVPEVEASTPLAFDPSLIGGSDDTTILNQAPVIEQTPVAPPVIEQPVQQPVFEQPLAQEPVFEAPQFAQPVVQPPVFEQPAPQQFTNQPTFNPMENYQLDDATSGATVLLIDEDIPAVEVKKAFLIVQSVGEAVEVTGDNFIVGAGEGYCNYVLRNPSVSRMHLSIRFDGQDYYAIDNGSTNGTIVNGVKLEPGVARKLEDLDQLILANELIDFQLS